MKKGFTLIELLAVIVILAVIAVIATPIVLKIVNSSKQSAAINSAKNYVEAVEQAIVQKNLHQEDFYPNRCDMVYGTRTLSCAMSNGEIGVLEVKTEGELPVAAILIIEDDKVVDSNDLGEETIITFENIAVRLGEKAGDLVAKEESGYIKNGLVIDADIKNYDGGGYIQNLVKNPEFYSFAVEGNPEYDGEYIRLSKDNRIYVPYTSQPLTIEMVATPETNTNVAYFGYGPGGASQNQFTVFIRDNKLSVFPSTPTMDMPVRDPAILTKHSISAVISKRDKWDGLLTLYQNGNLLDEDISLAHYYDDNRQAYLFYQGIRFGSRDVGTNYIKVYAIRIYNRILTDEEIAHNYEIDQEKYGI